MLLEKLNAEAERWAFNQRIVKAKQPKKPISKVDQKMSKIADLRQKTCHINYEMDTDRVLAAETKKHKEASLALYLANLTPDQKREHDQDMRRIAKHYSAICPEASHSWREDAKAEFGNRYRTIESGTDSIGQCDESHSS
jgi:hypothetical protein